MAENESVTIGLSSELHQQLSAHAAREGCSEAALVSHVLEEYLAYESSVRRKIQEGIDDAKAGRLIPHEEVMARIDAIIRKSSHPSGLN